MSNTRNSLRAGIDPETIPVAKKYFSFFKKIVNSMMHLWRAFLENKILIIIKKTSMNLIEMKYDKEPVFISSVFQNISG